MSQGQLNEQLFNAVESGNLDSAKDAIDKGADINSKDGYDYTPLHWAAHEGHLDVVKFLIDKGADVNAKERNGFTSLHLAAREGHLNVVEFLVSEGADVDAKEINDHTPLHLAALKGHRDVVEFLISKGAGVDAKDINSFRPLHCAILGGHLDVVKSLISKGADVNAKERNGFTPLYFAVFKGRLDVMKFLINNDADANTKDKHDSTPLHWAARAGRLNVVKFLINNDADINAKDKYGNTPLYRAVLKGHLDVANLLILHTLLRDSEVEKPEFITSTLKLSKLWDNLKREVQKMQTENSSLFELLCDSSRKIGDSTVSLHSFLFESNENRLAGYLSNQEAGLQSTLEDFIQRYPDIAEVSGIMSQYRRGIERVGLLDEAVQNFDCYGRSGKILPSEMRREIANYLTNEDLKNLEVALNGHKGRALKIIGGLLLMIGVAFCVYGCLAAGIPLLFVGALAYGLSTDIGCEICEKISSKFNNPDIAQPAQTAGIVS